MKCSPLLLSYSISLVSLSPQIDAQEVSLADALDTEGINWSSSVLWETGGNTPTFQDINSWHGVTEGSYDGEDALYAQLPESPSAYTHLSATVQGPFEYSFWYNGQKDGAGWFSGSVQGDNYYHTIQFGEHDGEWHQASGKIRTSS